MIKIFITGTHHDRSLGQAIQQRIQTKINEGNSISSELIRRSLNLNFEIVNTIYDSNVFINCRHEGYTQVDYLYTAAKMKKRIINIGSRASDGIKPTLGRYAVEKAALEKANEQLFYKGINTTIIKFGHIKTSRTMMRNVPHPLMSLTNAVNVVLWVMDHPNRIKDITICP